MPFLVNETKVHEMRIFGYEDGDEVAIGYVDGVDVVRITAPPVSSLKVRRYFLRRENC